MKLIDTHIHLNSSKYDGVLAVLLEQAISKGIEQWIVPGTRLSDIARQLEISQQYQGSKNAFGIHPWFVESASADWAQDLEAAIMQFSPVAIGECGLDFTREDPVRQREIFEIQVNLSIKHDLPLIIHSYKAVDDVLKILRQYPKARGVFHAINASVQQLTKILDLGFYVGFGGAVTYSRAKRLQRLLQETPLNRLVLETDGPYQVGAYKASSELNLPSDLISIAHFIAEQKSLTFAEIAKITTDNAIHFFNLEIK